MKRLLLLGIVLSLFCIAFTTTRVIQGTVTDEKGNPVAGATIIIKGTQIGLPQIRKVYSALQCRMKMQCW
jgi:hypothetical protein